MFNSSKELLQIKITFIGIMAVAPQSAVEALGFVPGDRHVPGPSYTRFTIVDVWDGAQVVPMVMHLPLSTSLITSLLLQCDPDEVIRYPIMYEKFMLFIIVIKSFQVLINTLIIW